MRRVMIAGVVLTAVAGCGEKPYQFADIHQEVRYLESVANPTPEQFRRKEALMNRIALDKQDQANRDFDAQFKKLAKEVENEKKAGLR